ncbi:D-arabinono-1,4-lactone oxidase [Kitasatospora sp. NPDC059795]|uniref:D-arabinono-1,4-lactone oxidase n=1 Tax=Kitasatospora sp. NPDC059795 TaxID=3346949 RepID=UPI00364C36B9
MSASASRTSWRNWSGTARCTPQRILRPVGEAALVDAVLMARRFGVGIRAAGTGHSFNQLAVTDGLLVDLTRHTGIVSVDRAAPSVTVRSGTRLGDLATALRRIGLALPNIGTLAEQTVGGALATGNHGTGLSFGPLSGLVTALRLVTADGAVHALDAEHDPALFHAARTSVGALGLVSSITFRCVPAFNLEVRESSAPLDTVLKDFSGWAASAEHISMSWLPWKPEVGIRTMNRTDAPPTPRARLRRYTTTVQELCCGVTGVAGRGSSTAVPVLSRALARPLPGPADYVDVSDQVFTFPQPVKQIALEHALPLDRTPDALRELTGALKRAGQYSPYSVLVRVGAGDDSPLSPAYGRDTGYVNLTVSRSPGQVELLRVIEHVMRAHGGRPHWGKAHTATAEVLAPRYPRWADFQRERSRVDPDGVFAGDYAVRLLGPVGAPERAVVA